MELEAHSVPRPGDCEGAAEEHRTRLEGLRAMTSNVCPTCGAVCGPVEIPDLTRPELDMLRAARMRPGVEAFRVSDLAHWSGWDYGRAWRAANKLFLRGFVERDERRRVVPLWGKLPIPTRAAVSSLMDADTPDGAELVFGEPGKWGRLLGWLVAHFGGSIVEG